MLSGKRAMARTPAMKIRKPAILLLAALLAKSSPALAAETYDIVIDGGTSAGIIADVQYVNYEELRTRIEEDGQILLIAE